MPISGTTELLSPDSFNLKSALNEISSVCVGLILKPAETLIKRSMDAPVPFSPPLEKAFLPKVEDVVREARRLVAY